MRSNKPIILIWFTVISLSVLVAYRYVSYFGSRSDRVPMRFGPLKYDFIYIDSKGQEGRLGDLKGKVWILNQIFTHCPTVCSPMTNTLVNLQKKLSQYNDKFTLVSITFDPEHDTPEVLNKYASKHNVDFSNWLWITGKNREIIEQYLIKAFKFGSKKNEEGKSEHGFYDHTNYIALIDADLGYREYYDTNRINNGDLERDIIRLIKENESKIK